MEDDEKKLSSPPEYSEDPYTTSSEENLHEALKLARRQKRREVRAQRAAVREELAEAVRIARGQKEAEARGEVWQDDSKNNQESTDQRSPPQVSAIRTAFIIVALWSCVFLVALDQNIVAPALPALASDLQGWNSIGWYGAAYLLTTCALQLPFGRLYSKVPVLYVFLAAIFLFALGSLLCAVAPNDPAFIIGRAIGGCGCAGIYSGALVTISVSFLPEKQPLYSGLIGTCFGLASVIGPILGGAFTDGPGWRWCFWINLPIGGAAAFILIFSYKPLYPQKREKLSLAGWMDVINPLGLITLLPGLICVLTALQLSGITYPWNNHKIITLWTVGCVFSGIFVVLQFSRRLSMIPHHVVKNRNMLCGMLFAFSSSASFFVVAFYMPIWFQLVRGESALLSGIHLIPTLISMIVIGLICAVLTTFFGAFQSFLLLASWCMSVASGLVTTMSQNSVPWYPLGLQILFGGGFGFAVQQPVIIVQSSLDEEDMSIGLAMMVFAQTLGGAIFVPVAANRFADSIKSEIQSKFPQYSSFLTQGSGAELNPTILRYFPQLIPLVNDSLIQAFVVAVPLAVFGFVVGLLLKYDRTRKLTGGISM